MRILSLLCVLIVGSSSYASGVGFTGIDKAEFKDIIEDFSAVFTHTSVSPASSLGKIFGFEIGVIVGASKTESIDKLSKQVDPTSSVEHVPHAGLLGVVTFPLGISGEINFLPKIDNSDINLQTGSLGIKWTVTDVFPLPVDIALKIHSANSTIGWNQTAVGDVKYKQSVTGLMIQVSKKFTLFEPYVNLGSVKSEGELSAPVSIFDPAYTTSTSSKEKVSGGMFMVGTNLNLVIFKLGAEAGKVLGNNKISLKASFYF
jgi:hypothetical protein